MSGRRPSRRQFLAGTGAAALLSACGSGAKRPLSPPDAATATATAGEIGTPALTATPAPRRTGGVPRLVSPRSFTFDTFDAQRTGDVSTLEVLGRTHSRIIQWLDSGALTLEGELASAWEQPDAQTWVLRLDPNARWHDRAPLNGRPVTADDVVAHLQRGIALARSGQIPTAQRQQDVQGISRVTSPADGIVRVETDGPGALLPLTLAGQFALVQAPEAVAAFETSWPQQQAAEVVGSGSFMFAGVDGGSLVFTAAPAAHQRARVDGLRVAQPAASSAAFRSKAVDDFLARDRRDAPALRGDLSGQLVESGRFEERAVISTFFIGAPPWNDARLVQALSMALNRAVLADRLFGGRAAASGPVPPSSPGFASGAAELAKFPGYRAGAAADATEARSLWEAAGGPALGQVTIDFPSIFDPPYSASSIVIGMLSSVLGPQFRPAVETYTTIARKVTEHRYGAGNAAFWFGWGPPFAGPDPSRALAETYRSGSPGAADTGFASTRVDALVDELLRTPGLEGRQRLTREVSSVLLSGSTGGIVTWVVQRSEHFRWRYLDAPGPSPWWSQHRDVAVGLDAVHPTYVGRP